MLLDIVSGVLLIAGLGVSCYSSGHPGKLMIGLILMAVAFTIFDRTSKKPLA